MSTAATAPRGASGIAWSICVQRADTGEVLLQENRTATLRTASIGKLLLLVTVAELAASGELDLGAQLTRTPADLVADSGVWQHLSVPSLCVEDLCNLVGMASDNLATNVLLRRVGLPAVAATTAALGLRTTMLHDRVRDVRGPHHPPTLSTGNAAELADLMTRLPMAVRGWLAHGLDLSQVAAGWGLDPLAHHELDRGLSLVHKTGTDAGIRAEVGLLSGPAATIAYAVIANWDDAADPAARDEVLARQRQIGLFIEDAARW